jgi:hypothetical protein
MDDQTLNAIFRSMARHETRPAPDCPEDVDLVAALDGSLDPKRRAVIELHAADCDHCVARLGRIGRLKRADSDERVSEITMARARKLVRKPSKIRHASRWAAAAVVLLAVFSVARFGSQSENVETTTLPAPDLRSLDHDAYRPAVLFPSDGARIGVEGSMFRWSMVPGSLHYDVRVVSADGGMIWQERVEGTEWRLPTACPASAPSAAPRGASPSRDGRARRGSD